MKKGGTEICTVLAVAATAGTAVAGPPEGGISRTEIAAFAGSKPVPFTVSKSNGSAVVVLRDVRLTYELEVRVNAAVTAWFEFIDTVQLAVPEQAPDHPANVEPALGVAVNVTTVPVA